MALNLKSQRQIQTDILAPLITRLGLNDVNRGSVLDILTQAISQQHFSLYYQIAQVSRLADIDAMFGTDLDNKGFEYGKTRRQAVKAKGRISILRPTGFTKVSTTFYAGSPSPITGDTFIDVNSASSALIGTSGTLILGRGTNNEEEVPYVVAPTNLATFWRFQLSSPLTKDHAVEETVVLKQGNDETILAGTIVVVPATGVNSEIRFSIDNDTTLLAGEDKVENVEVTAQEEGTDANIPVGAIDGESAFSSPPFSGARARNDVKFTTGKDLQSDDEFRDEIKKYIQGISKAVKEAILNAIVGLVDPETAKRVVSASIVLPIGTAGDVKLYIDDGSGFEPTMESIGFETVLGSATGGEQRLQVAKFPIVKAYVESNSAEPFDMSSGTKTLTYQVGTIQETISFFPADFRSSAIATAEEIAAVINNRSTMVEARTSQLGKYVLITAKRDVNESIQVVGGTANSIISFPTDRKETISLYIDDVKKSKDGQTATLDSGNQAPYNLSAIGAFPHTLTIVVDGKTANVQTATFEIGDTVDPTAVTVAEICAVINRDISGITATAIDSNTKIRLESLTKLSSKSKIKINGGTLNDATNGLDFSTDQVEGIDGDYIFNRELGIIELVTPLTQAQNVTLGNLFTRGKHRAQTPELYVPANGTTLVISIDGGADQTITFDSSFAAGKTAQQTADFINLTLKGGTAIVRQIGGLNYLEINTNTYTGDGYIQIKSTSTANSSFGFTTDQVSISGAANKSFIMSATGPFNFAENDQLVTVVDDDIVNNTFSIPMNYASTLTGATSTSGFSDSSLGNIFPLVDQIKDFYVAFKSGANTTEGVVETVAVQGGGIVRYTFNPTPANFADYAANDLAKIEDLANSLNNGNFVIQAKGANYIDVVNPDGVNASAQAGAATLSQRRQIFAYNQLTGGITVSSGFSNTPVIGDEAILIPSTVQNLVEYIKNTKITGFTLKGIVEGVEGNTKLQLSSKSNGSDGYIQVTGGAANRELEFSTLVSRGLQAYSYSTGLTALVHKTIYGDDSDLASFPGVGAAGITFRVLAPTIQNLEIELDVTLQDGVSISSVENEVRSAVTGYVNTLGVGEDVIIERIRAAVIAIPGIVDVEINSPTENIPIADNERAFVADPDILIG